MEDCQSSGYGQKNSFIWIAIKGLSDLVVEVFGEASRDARSSIGGGSLLENMPIEFEMIVEMKQ